MFLKLSSTYRYRMELPELSLKVFQAEAVPRTEANFKLCHGMNRELNIELDMEFD